MPDRIPPTYETFDCLTIGDDGVPEFLKAQPMSDKPGFDGYLVPWFTLSDRGSYFVPGSLKKTAREQLKAAPHLWSHNSWVDTVPPGHHTAAVEDDTGFRISVAMNEGIKEGADIMSALRFGTPLGLSIGFTTVRDRSGTEEDDKKLDRRTAPDYLKNVPINELRAITEAKWFESSSVVFAAIATAKPDEIRSA
jgi:HK97 family phage prohead protease